MKKTISLLLCLLLLLSGLAVPALAAPAGHTARPSVNGRVHVEGTSLADEAGQTAVLRGVSTHGLTWFPTFINEGLFQRVSAEWNANLIRLPVYVSQYCGGHEEECMTLLRKGIDAAIAADMYVLLSIFLVDGRDDDMEPVKVQDFIPVSVDVLYGGSGSAAGITAQLNEHCMTMLLDEGVSPGIGAHVRVHLAHNGHEAAVNGVVTGIRQARRSQSCMYTVEILDFGDDRYEYWEILYDRIPTLPQSLKRDYGIIPHLWQNIAHRVARTTR